MDRAEMMVDVAEQVERLIVELDAAGCGQAAALMLSHGAELLRDEAARNQDKAT